MWPTRGNVRMFQKSVKRGDRQWGEQEEGEKVIGERWWPRDTSCTVSISHTR